MFLSHESHRTAFGAQCWRQRREAITTIITSISAGRNRIVMIRQEICLDAIAGFDRDQRGRDYVAGESRCRELPVQASPGGIGSVAHRQLTGEARPGHQALYRVGLIVNDSQAANVPVRLGNSNRNGVRADIETRKSYFRQAANFFLCGRVPRSRRSTAYSNAAGVVGRPVCD